MVKKVTINVTRIGARNHTISRYRVHCRTAKALLSSLGRPYRTGKLSQRANTLVILSPNSAILERLRNFDQEGNRRQTRRSGRITQATQNRISSQGNHRYDRFRQSARTLIPRHRLGVTKRDTNTPTTKRV